MWKNKDSTQQKMLDFRSTRDNGNKFAKYAGAAVFAPMIFVIPFPTVVGTPEQQNQQFINGGNFVKNVLGFFMLIAVYDVIKRRKFVGYVVVSDVIKSEAKEFLKELKKLNILKTYMLTGDKKEQALEVAKNKTIHSQ